MTNFFEPLDALQTLQRVAFIYLQSSNVRLFVKLALFVVVPATAIVLSILFLVVRGTIHHHDHDDQSSIQFFFQHFWKYIAVLGSQSLLKDTLGAVAEGAIGIAVADLYLNRHPRWFVCLQRASQKIVTLMIAGFMAGFAILMGYFFLYVPGVFLKLHFLLITPVILLDSQDHSAFSALARSWNLVSNGHRMYVLKCMIGMDVLYWFANYLLGRAVSLLASDDSLTQDHPIFSLTFQFLKAFPASVFLAAFGILKTVIYINLLVKDENITEPDFGYQMDQHHGGFVVPLLPDDDDEDQEHDPALFDLPEGPLPEATTSSMQEPMLDPATTAAGPETSFV